MFDPSLLSNKLSKYFELRFKHDNFRFKTITIELDQGSMRLSLRYDILANISDDDISKEVRNYTKIIHEGLNNWFLVDYSSINIIKNLEFEMKMFIFDDNIMEFISQLMKIDSLKELAHLKLDKEVPPTLFYKIQEFSIFD